MTTAATVILAMSWPILMVIGLFMLAAWRDHRRGAVVSRQIRLADAIADELGLIVAPLVAKPLGGPWRVKIRVPMGRPATVSRIVAIAHDTLTRTGAGQYELVLTPEPARVHTLGGATRPARRPGRPRTRERDDAIRTSLQRKHSSVAASQVEFDTASTTGGSAGEGPPHRTSSWRRQ